MGHASIQTTEEFYLRSTDANEQRACQALDNLMGMNTTDVKMTFLSKTTSRKQSGGKPQLFESQGVRVMGGTRPILKPKLIKFGIRSTIDNSRIPSKSVMAL